MSSSDIIVEVQYTVSELDLPVEQQLKSWVDAAVEQQYSGYELVIRIVDEAESASLNSRYRNKPGATNVLSFVADIPEGVDLPLLGDLVICAPVVAQEAREQAKDLSAHWAHMVVHGALHLQGYDHQDEVEAEDMEMIERQVLERLGFVDPYRFLGRPLEGL